MATSVRVAVRARPLSAKERLASARDVLRFEPDGQTVILNAGTTSMTSQSSDALRLFNYDHAFSPSVPQSYVYEVCAKPLMEKFLDGFNATILAYGQTGSGKTHSMGTGLDGNLNTEQQGIVPRAISALFAHLDKKDPARFRYRVAASFLELYNEELIDLLNPRMASKLQIREDGQGGVTWTGVREEECKRVEEVLAVLQRGSLCRTTGATEMNVQSSRSHAIFSVTLRQQKWEQRKAVNTAAQPEPSTNSPDPEATATVGDAAPTATEPPPSTTEEGVASDSDGEWHHITSKFHFVDLAGSERLKRTRAEGDRAKEGISINQGLLALGNVISALTEEAGGAGSRPGSARHVPYRDSKLTRLLQDSLGGNSQTLMLACVAAGDSDIAETLGTLRYAERARRIKNRAVINRDFAGGAAPEEVTRLRKELETLRRELDIARGIRPEGNDGRESGTIVCARCGAGVGPPTLHAASSVPNLSRLGNAVALPATQQSTTAGSSNANTALLEKELHLVRAARDKALQDVQMLQFSVNRMKERREEQDRMVSEWRTEYETWVVEKGVKRKREIETKGCVTSDEPNTDGSNARTSPCKDSPASPSQGTAMEELAIHPFILRHLEELRQASTRAQDAEDRAEYFEKRCASLQQQISANSQLGVGISLSRKPSYVSGFDTRPTELEVKALEEIREKRQALDAVARAASGFASVPNTGLFRPRQSRMRDLEIESAATDEHQERKVLTAIKTDPDVRKSFDEMASPTSDASHGVPESPTSRALASIPESPSGLAFSVVSGNESSTNDPGAPPTPETPVSAEATHLYSLISRLQADISTQEQLVDQLQRSRAEMTHMELKYGEKLGGLMEGLEKVTRERDEALRRMEEQQANTGSIMPPGVKEKPGTAALRVKYENHIKRLTAEVEDTRRKYLEANRAVVSKKRQEETLMKALKQNIESLKTEKVHMLKQLKEEAEKRRMIEMDKQREARKAKKLEEEKAKIQREYELRLRLRQNEQKKDVDKNKYNPITILKRITTPKSISKMFNGSRGRLGSEGLPGGPLGSALGLGPENIESASLKSMTNIARDENDFASTNAATVRATFKKEIVDGELTAWVSAKEHFELLAELRRRKEQLVVDRTQLEHELDAIGWQSNDALHYADELELADEEINIIDSRIANLESRANSTPSAADDKGYENALNLLHALDTQEISRMAELLLEDLVGSRLRLRMEALKCQDLESRRKEMLKAMQNMKNAGIAMEGYFEKRLADLRERLGLNLERRAAKRGLPHVGLPGLLEEGHQKAPDDDAISVQAQSLFGYEQSEPEFSEADETDGVHHVRGRPRTAPARSSRAPSQDSQQSVALTSRQVFHHLFKQGLRGQSLDRSDLESADNYALASAVVEGAFERTGMHLEGDDAASILSASVSANGLQFDKDSANQQSSPPAHSDDKAALMLTTAPIEAEHNLRTQANASVTRLNGVEYSNQLDDSPQRSSQYQLFFQEITGDEATENDATPRTASITLEHTNAPSVDDSLRIPELRVQEPTPNAVRTDKSPPLSKPPPLPFEKLQPPKFEQHDLKSTLTASKWNHAASSSTPNLSQVKSDGDPSPTDLAAFASTHSDEELDFDAGIDGDHEDGDSSPTRPTPKRSKDKQHGKANLVRSGSEIVLKRGDDVAAKLGTGRIPTRVKDSRNRSKSPLGESETLKPPSRSTSPSKPSSTFNSSVQSRNKPQPTDSSVADGVPRSRPASALSEHTAVPNYIPSLSADTYCRKCRRHHHYDHEHLRTQRAAKQQESEVSQPPPQTELVPDGGASGGATSRPQSSAGGPKRVQRQNSGNDSQWWERLTKTNTVATSLKIRPPTAGDHPPGEGHSRRPSAQQTSATSGISQTEFQLLTEGLESAQQSSTVGVSPADSHLESERLESAQHTSPTTGIAHSDARPESGNQEFGQQPSPDVVKEHQDSSEKPEPVDSGLHFSPVSGLGERDHGVTETDVVQGDLSPPPVPGDGPTDVSRTLETPAYQSIADDTDPKTIPDNTTTDIDNQTPSSEGPPDGSNLLPSV